MTSEITPEFSRVFELADASERARELDIAADDAQCAALAKRFQVTKVNTLKANLTLAPHSEGTLVTGHVEGKVEQPCGITGARVDSEVRSDINVLLWTGDVNGDLELLEEAYGVDDIDVIAETSIDVGELAAQYFGLAIDPFPRAEGASLDAILPQERANPFSVLAQLKDKG